MRKRETIDLFVWLFFTCLVLTFPFMGSLLICINNFVNVSAKALFWSCVSIVIVSVVIAVLMVKNTKQFQETRFSFWLGKNSPKLLLSYFLIVFALVSIRSEPTWDANTVYDILSLQWTIFGLSLTIFLVWNVIIVEFFKNTQPKEPDPSDSFQKYKLVLEKKSFSQELETTFSTIVLLTINLFLLLLSTSLIYISAEYESIITQNILRFTFFFTTNSIVCLFLDLLTPLEKDRAEMLKRNQVTKEDIDKAQLALFTQAIIKGIEEGVMSLDSEKYTEEEKKKLIAEYLEAFKDGWKSKDNIEAGEQKK